MHRWVLSSYRLKFNVARRTEFVSKGGGGGHRQYHTFCHLRTTLIILRWFFNKFVVKIAENKIKNIYLGGLNLDGLEGKGETRYKFQLA